MDLYKVSMEREQARRLLIKNALSCAWDEFHDDPADPGWESEMHDEALVKSATSFVTKNTALNVAKTGPPYIEYRKR